MSVTNVRTLILKSEGRGEEKPLFLISHIFMEVLSCVRQLSGTVANTSVRVSTIEKL